MPDPPVVRPPHRSRGFLVFVLVLDRLRNARTGREVVMAAQQGLLYINRHTREPLDVVGKLLPLAGSSSRLRWAVENLRVCPTCNELVQNDLNYCPYDGRRLPPLDGTPGSDSVGVSAKGAD
ncbi:MAG TPA: hypothetical protein VK778_12485 [Solirubrobacteraceae bacterium]|nr:hypothetical protein [Solirubrobacteraceae bacterium]